MPKKRKDQGKIPVLTVIDFENRRMDEFISQAEAARQLDVSRATVNFLVSKGKLRSHVIAGRKVVLVEDVLAYNPTRPGPKRGGSKPKASTKKKVKK